MERKNKNLVNLSNNDDKPKIIDSWVAINWSLFVQQLSELQQELVKFYSTENYQEISRIQHIILTSRFTHCLAVKKVTKKNKIIWDTSVKRWGGVIQCWHIMQNPRKYEPKPLKRVYIEKVDGKKRALSIPTIVDRCIQAIYLFAMDPIVECISDTESFGFRKNRSTHDAILSLRGKLVHPDSAEYILSCDIKNCFDNIVHDPLLKVIWHQRVLNRKCDLEVIENWLKKQSVNRNRYARCGMWDSARWYN